MDWRSSSIIKSTGAFAIVGLETYRALSGIVAPSIYWSFVVRLLLLTSPWRIVHWTEKEKDFFTLIIQQLLLSTIYPKLALIDKIREAKGMTANCMTTRARNCRARPHPSISLGYLLTCDSRFENQHSTQSSTSYLHQQNQFFPSFFLLFWYGCKYTLTCKHTEIENIRENTKKKWKVNKRKKNTHEIQKRRKQEDIDLKQLGEQGCQIL